MLIFGLIVGFLALALGFADHAAAAPTTVLDDRSRLFTLPTPPADPDEPMPPSDKVTITDNAALALGSAFTLQAWVRPATDSGEQMILEKRQSYALAFRNGTLQYQLDSELTGTRGIWFDTQLVLLPNRWTHVTLVKSGQTVTVYLNGTAEYTQSLFANDEFAVSYGIPTLITVNANPLLIGSDLRENAPFNGRISDVSIWSSARSASVIAATYDLRFAASVGTWFLDELMGPTAYNSSQAVGSILNGSYTGTVTSTEVPALGARLNINDTPAFDAYLPGYDPAGPVTFTAATTPTLGTLAITDPSTGAFTLTPDIDANGLDSFGYTVTDGSTTTAERTYAVRITDATKPSVTGFTTTSGAYNHDATQTFTLTFSEPVTGITAGDFTNLGDATGCSIDPGDDTGATRTVTVSSCSEGTLQLRFAANGAADAVGNTGPAAAVSTTVITVDRTPPAVSSFTTTLTGMTRITPQVYTLTFSESVTGITAADFTNVGTSTGCVFDPGADTGSTRTVSISSCANGTLQPRLRADAADDLSGTAGPATAATVTDAITLDTVPPTSFATISRTATNNPTVTVSYTASDVGTVQTIDAYYSTSMSMTFPEPCGQTTSSAASGTVACDLPATDPVDGSRSTDGTYYVWTIATDSAGNVEATPLTYDAQIILDRVPPLLSSFTTTSATVSGATTFTYSLTFSESVTGIGSGDFRNRGTATGCTFNPGTDNGTTRTLTVTGCSTGTLLPAFAATGAQDLAGNLGPATEQDAASTVTIDRAAPTLANFALAGTEGATMTFSPSSFAAPFADDRALEPDSIMIKTLPSSGALWFSGSLVTVNQVIPYNDLGQLSYVPTDYANGTFTFTVTASDGVNSSSPATTVSVVLAPVTNQPTVTHIDPLTGANEDQTFTITYAALLASSDAVARDATLQFRIESVVTGSVSKGGVAVTPGVTAIGPGESFVWTPPANAYGLLNAFTVRAYDGTTASASAILVQAQVAAQACPTTDTVASGWNIRQVTATGECSWVAPAGVTSIQTLVVGGGGGGGAGVHTSGGTFYTGGGGGAGGLVNNTG